MKSLVKSLNILNWPLWLKLSAGMAFGVAVPILLVAIIGQSSVRATSLNTVKQRLDDIGRQQQQVISDELSRASITLNVLVTRPGVLEPLQQLLAPGGTDFRRIQQVSLTLQRELTGYSNFRSMRVMNTDGNILAQTSATSILTNRDSAVGTPAFTAATSATLSGRDSALVVSSSGLVAVEFIQTIHDIDDNPVGYLVGVLDHENLLTNRLQRGDENFPTYSYLTTGQVVIAPSNAIADSRLSAQNSQVVQQAFNLQSATEEYGIGAQQTRPVIGYFAPILNPTDSSQAVFALVTEVPAEAVTAQTFRFLGGAGLFVSLVGLVLAVVLVVLLLNQLITPPLTGLREAMQGVLRGEYDLPVPSATGRADEIGSLSAAFVDMRTYVHNLLDDLEARVAARARDISATQEVSRFAATQRNLQTLMDQVVELITEKFTDIYHAQIFLIDSERAYAVLSASTGEAGKQLLARGHRLNIGSQSVIGQVTAQARIIVARDTDDSTVHKRNELLPETRAELAIPLRIGDTIIGALDVQSRIRNAFSEDEILILQTMADQVAVAIENARLYQESVRRLEEIERSNRQATVKTWQEYLYAQRLRQLSSEAGLSTGVDNSDLRQRAVTSGKIVVGEHTGNQTIPIAVPIQLRGQTLGAVEWEIPESDLSDNKLQLAQELANRLAVSLDNARLFQESQRAAERERIVNAISAKLTPQTEISDILQTAVREVGQALRSPQVSIRLHRANGQDKQQPDPAITNGANGHLNGNGNGTH